jgi:putative endonuclease
MTLLVVTTACVKTVKIMRKYWIYIVGNKYLSSLYTGVTNNLVRRVWEHKCGNVEGFTHKYRCSNLLYFEEYGDINNAIAREKQIKGWRRDKKIELIISMNPDRVDLAADWFVES